MGRIRCLYFSNAASASLTLPTAGTVKGVCNNAWYVVQACCWAASHKNSAFSKGLSPMRPRCAPNGMMTASASSIALPSRKLPELTVFRAHGVFGAANDFVDVGGTGDQWRVVCLDSVEACPSIGHHIQAVEESEGRAVS